MSTPASFCPHCAAAWPPGADVCPNCGYVRPGLPAWPPRPVGFVAPSPPPAPRMVTGVAAGDVTLGLGSGLALSLVTLALTTGIASPLPANPAYGLGLFVPPVLYLVLRRGYPAVARGLGFAALICLIVLPCLLVVGLVLGMLGFLSTCAKGMNNSN